MNEDGFRKFLKAKGKKQHVIDGLVQHVRIFESHSNLEKATATSIGEYARLLPADQVRKRMRGIALYYRFLGKGSLAEAAAGIRESKIATTRRVFKLDEFRGVNPDHISKLAAMGIVAVDQMLLAGKTPSQRQKLARQTRIPLKVIVELVKLSDLSRLGGVKGVRTRLYYDAGLDTLDKFDNWEPDALRTMLIDFVQRTGFDGIAPLPKELRNTIATARQLPRAVTY